jgi:hypothetical protein
VSERETLVVIIVEGGLACLLPALIKLSPPPPPLHVRARRALLCDGAYVWYDFVNGRTISNKQYISAEGGDTHVRARDDPGMTRG